MVVSCLAVYAAVQLLHVDWASYGPAEPPAPVEGVDNTLLTLRNVRIGPFDALNESPELTWSQHVPVSVEGDAAHDRFVVRSVRSQRSQTNQLRSSIRLDIARRSSLNDGSNVVSRVASAATVDSDNRLRWSDTVWVPRVPGEYQVRVILMTFFRDEQDEKHSAEAIVGSFGLRVLQGEPANDE